ncbi:testicular acid phosphatase homolog isoform X2 [Symsagittifera roscoffensis]|uniref:testicular acid phosphatase homolog isoform X2 n=1 Tax=Symsagittifera roscoffensis TaxID=84072 RepID=UPI00307BB3A0
MILFLVLLLSILLVPRSQTVSVLPLLVQQVCRHGDRSPVTCFPNNQNKDFWLQGPGYLTPKGEKQLYDNGKAFRSDWYPGLLSDVVLPSESYVVSSHFDRCLMSANSFMAGLYPPTDEFLFEKGLNWQAYPTHMISADIDYYLSGTTCPAQLRELERILSSPVYKQFETENQEFINTTCRLAGYHDDRDWNAFALQVINDNLICDAAHGLPLPEWASENVLTEIKNIVNMQYSILFSDPAGTFLFTGGGPLLGLMVENMQKKMNGTLTQKLMYYSAHDSTILSFFGNLEQEVGPNPPYGSCGVLELYEDSNNKYFVQLSFRNSTLGMMNEARMMPNCDDVMCDYATFSDMVADKVNMDPKAACNSF